MKYVKVIVKEILEKEIIIEIEGKQTEEDAIEQVGINYRNEDIVLDFDDFKETEIKAVGIYKDQECNELIETIDKKIE